MAVVAVGTVVGVVVGVAVGTLVGVAVGMPRSDGPSHTAAAMVRIAAITGLLRSSRTTPGAGGLTASAGTWPQSVRDRAVA
jgi:hypothetical protein